MFGLPIYEKKLYLRSKFSYQSSKIPILQPYNTPRKNIKKNDSNEDQNISDVIFNIPFRSIRNHQNLVLPLLPKIPSKLHKIDQNDAKLILQKIAICSNICCFEDPLADMSAKKIKNETLKELLTIFTNCPTSFPINLIDSLFNMISINLFRNLPPIDKKYLFSDSEPLVVDVRWPHLHLVYLLLLGYQRSVPKDVHFTLSFAYKMANLLNSPDANERCEVLKFLNTYVISFPESLSSILQYLNDGLQRYINKNNNAPPFCVPPTLSFFLTLLQNGYIPKITNIFSDTIFPLLGGQHLLSYLPQLSQIFHFVISNDIIQGHIIVSNILHHWPLSAPSKQVTILTLLNETVEELTNDEFRQIYIPLFHLYASCALSNHSSIVEASFSIWSNPKIVSLIINFSKHIFPLIIHPLIYASKESWSPTIQNQAMFTLRIIRDIDSIMFNEIMKKRNQIDPDSIDVMYCFKKWQTIILTAFHNDQSFNFTKKLFELQTILFEKC